MTSRNLTLHPNTVSRAQREALIRQKGCVVWFTGLSGSGKSTIANALAALLHERGHLAYILDGDNLRHGLNSDLGFSSGDRTENIRRAAEVAAILAEAGIITITAFISPFADDRQAARSRSLPGRFVEVFVDAPLEVCEQRDPKGLYARARRGEVREFTGVSSPYEPPVSPEITIRSAVTKPDDAARVVCEDLAKRGLLSGGDES